MNGETISGMTMDITDKKKAQNEIKKSLQSQRYASKRNSSQG